jgi:hypothetical protein
MTFPIALLIMRQCAQFQMKFSCGNILTQPAGDAAIEEMLFTGGALNRRLLGGEGTERDSATGTS